MGDIPGTILAVDTSSPTGSVALVGRGVVKGHVGLDIEKTYSERLLPTIEFLLEMLDIGMDDVEGFAVIAGPGSFTGVRIGICTVQGLCQGTGKPASSASTLEVMAVSEGREGGLIVPMMNAGRSRVFATVYEIVREGRSGRGRFRQLVEEMDVSPEDFLSSLGEGPHLFTGSGAVLYEELITRRAKTGWRISPGEKFLASHLGLLVSREQSRERWVHPSRLEANYIRKSDAEINRTGKG